MLQNNKENGVAVASKWGRTILMVVLDIIFINLAMILSLYIRFDISFFEDPSFNLEFMRYFNNYLITAPINTVLSVGVFAVFRLYSNILKYISFREICFELSSCVVSSVLYFAVGAFLEMQLPRSCYIISAMILMAFLMVSRYMIRFIQTVRKIFTPRSKKINVRRVMIIGAGNTAGMLIRELKSNEYIRQRRVVCVIDDDKAKIGRYIYGVKVVGDRNDIVDAALRYRINEIIYAIASAEEKDKAEILNICKKTKCVMRILPGIDKILENTATAEDLRKVQVEDLLGKPRVIKIGKNPEEYIKDKTVLITGGAGSIGVGLCKHIVLHKPRTVIVVDMFENNVVELQNLFRTKYRDINFISYVTTVRDELSVNEIFARHKPDAVFHCAAYKHVPVMQNNPVDAVKNNVFGALNVMHAADRNGVKKFIYVSTNKAYAPTNVMAATKHICEMFLQCFQKTSRTVFCAVRFGNVLGTSGGVVQIFEEQIKNGGPLLVTDPDITRNFITLGEVSALIVKAGGLSTGGEIYALGDGSPLKIADLAENMIRLSGYTPYVDIDIKFMGLREGEVLTEKPPIPKEAMSPTSFSNIFLCKSDEIEEDIFIKSIDKLGKTIVDEPSKVREVLSEIVGAEV